MARLQQAVADTLRVHPLFAGVAGASIGLAMFPQDAFETSTLIGNGGPADVPEQASRKAAHAGEPWARGDVGDERQTPAATPSQRRVQRAK